MIINSGMFQNFGKALVVVAHLQMKQFTQIVLITYVQLCMRYINTAA
jgi:hypothetical protein